MGAFRDKEHKAEYDHAYHFVHQQKRSEQKKVYYQVNKEAIERRRREYQKAHRDKANAHHRAWRAIRANLLKKGNQCLACGRQDIPIEGHHFDYGKPLELVWLCCSCHKKLHAIQRAKK